MNPKKFFSLRVNIADFDCVREGGLEPVAALWVKIGVPLVNYRGIFLDNRR